MGLTGGLVRGVFSKNRSVGSYDTNARSYGGDKRRWNAVRSYLCGDEFNSVLAEEDSASIRSFEATVTQTTVEYFKDEDIHREEKEEQITEETHNSPIVLSCEEHAAIIIQSAFRSFMVRCRDVGMKQIGETKIGEGMESPNMESVGTSIEVQTGGSVKVLTIQEERLSAKNRVRQKTCTHVSKLKEDWDDSTVSSNISKLRLQNRLEASTRRERALAYAFSQQLRVCSKKRPNQSDASEPNMGWSWLERWMATRPPDTFSVEDRMSTQHGPIYRDRRSGLTHKSFDLAAEEKESCGSNEVTVGIDYLKVTALDRKDSCKPVNRLKAPRTVLRCKTLPSYHYSTQFTKAASKKDYSREGEKDRKYKQTQQSQRTGETKDEDASARTICSAEHQ